LRHAIRCADATKQHFSVWVTEKTTAFLVGGDGVWIIDLVPWHLPVQDSSAELSNIF
jgi:hypothetical protein